MTNADFAKTLGKIDKDIIEQADNAIIINRNGSRMRLLQWASIAASFTLVIIMTTLFIYPKLTRSQENPSLPNMGESVGSSQSPANTSEEVSESEPVTNTDLLRGIIFNGKLYFPDTQLSEAANENNLGNIVGYVPDDHQTLAGMCIYEYLPSEDTTNDDTTNRVIVPNNGNYDVYAFYGYVPDGTDNWPVNLFANAVYIETGYFDHSKFPHDEYTVDKILTDPNGMLEFLTELNQSPAYKDNDLELGKHYYEKFKGYFNEDELWIGEDGDLHFKFDNYDQSVTLRGKFGALVGGNSRNIYVVMNDKTYLVYKYYEGAGTIRLRESYYILTEEQIIQLNQLIGLQ